VSLALHLPSRLHPAPGRLRAALLVLGSVLLLHTLLLGLVQRVPGRGWASQPARTVSVRQLPGPAAAPAPSRQAPPAQTRPPPHPQRSTPAPTAHMAATPEAVPSTAAGAAPQADTLPTPDPGGLQVPVYATQLPPAALLRFASRRGVASGTAELAWQPSADGYRLSLQGQALGAPFISWASAGAVDAAGLAPLRYTESRRGRELRAANFQRDAGQVSFSGPAVQHPLVAGMQDRLSWLIQLPAVLQANPALARPGEQVQLAVVGTRGDAEVWTFTVQGRGPLDLPGGTVPDAVHLLREPRRPYDTQVQVWLDPARQHLPVQAWLRVRATGEGTELRLLETAAP
jgi:hypothetical protein